MANRSRILRLAAVAPLVITMTVLGAPTGGAVDKPQGGTLVLASGPACPASRSACADESLPISGPRRVPAT